jgi:hypothetical protein
VTNKDRVISALSIAELCDDCLSVSSGVVPRQTVNIICRTLFNDSSIYRHYGKCDHCHKIKTTNRLLDVNTAPLIAVSEEITSVNTLSKPWYWEGNVQSHVINYLVQNHYTIRSVADTAARNPGKDIIAVSPDDKELWISVKGYPEKSQNVQARHWFSGALFDLVLYYGENSDAKLGIALPEGFVTYSSLLPRIRWLKDSMPFKVYWVRENGSVREE